MAISIEINNLKSIKRLEFNMPKPGAYVITGANGCGKTSLLIALHRMGAPNAFQTGLPGARQSHNIDGLYDARIQYNIVSTHSASLIKSVNRKQILYLENVKGQVKVHRNVYPTYALQHLSFEDASAPDRIVLVEDVAAKPSMKR